MTESKSAGPSVWIDPDDAPELDEAFFDKAEMNEGGKPVRRGRPPKARTKVAVNIRRSAEVLEHFKSGGPGWQTRIDEALKRAVHAK